MLSAIRARSLQKADRAAVGDLSARGVHWETRHGPWSRVFEVDGVIVGACTAAVEQIARPKFVPEPLPELRSPWDPGEHLALVGGGLVVAPDVDDEVATRIHRLARTLASQELGAQWCLIVAPLPTVVGLDAGAMLQQIAFGALIHASITIPLFEGYWPIGTHEGHAVLVRYNDL